MMYLPTEVINDNDFGGFLSDSSKFLDYERRLLSNYTDKEISFVNFLRYSKKNGSELILYYNDIVGANFFKDYLSALSCKYNFKVKNFIEFVYEKNARLIYDPMKNYIDETLKKKSEWIYLSTKVTDKFSRNSILAFLKSMENKSYDEIIPYIIPFEFEGFNKFSNHFSFVPNDEEIYVDIGAYDGDSIAKFIECTPTGKFKSIHAFEPNQSSYSKLSLMKQWIPNLLTYKLAASNVNSSLKFNQDGGSMAARIHKEDDINHKINIVTINAVKLDDVLEDVTFMKIDVEGFEADVLEGASRLIQKCKPTMIVDTYHHANDAIKIYEKVLDIHKYKFIGMRFAHANMQAHSLYFSDTKVLT